MGFRVVFGVALVCAAANLVSYQARTLDLLTASISDIQAAIDREALTYERLAALYLNRIDAYDRKGPRLRAVIAVNPHALDDARARDAERRSSGRRGPLHGIPIAIKDNIDVQGLPTTGGHASLRGPAAADDATVVRRLREAGAIVLMKTNMDELALNTRGLSSVGGQILNPYDLARGPGGSSGGTAVAVAAGFAAAGLATETGFSIRSPASNTALVAIAPSRGVVSRAGVMPVSFTQDRVGVHARSVADAALVLEAIRGFDADDLSTTAALNRLPLPSYARIGVLRDLFRKGEQFDEGNTIVERQIEMLREHGIALSRHLSTGADLFALMPDLRVNNFEMPAAFDSYLRRRGASRPVDSFATLVKTGKHLSTTLANRLNEMLRAGPFEFAQGKPLDRHPEYLARLDRQREIRQLLIDLMDREKIDALVYPVKSLPAPPLGSGDDGPRDNNISAVTGLPAVVLPAGLTAAGLPIAIEMLGRPFSEPRLIEIAHALEKAHRARAVPKSTPALPGDVIRY
jgi:amidase